MPASVDNSVDEPLEAAPIHAPARPAEAADAARLGRSIRADSILYRLSPGTGQRLAGAPCRRGIGSIGVVHELTSEAPDRGTFGACGALNVQSPARDRLTTPIASIAACQASRSPSLSGIHSRLPRSGIVWPRLFPFPPEQGAGAFFCPRFRPRRRPRRSRARRRGARRGLRCRAGGWRRTAAPDHRCPPRGARGPGRARGRRLRGSACRPC